MLGLAGLEAAAGAEAEDGALADSAPDELAEALELLSCLSFLLVASTSAMLGTSPPAVPLLLLLKSVTYQPVPLRINAVLLTNLLIGPPWQTTQSVGAGSVIFCMIS